MKYAKKGLYCLFCLFVGVLFALSIILLYGILSFEEYAMVTIGLGVLTKIIAMQVKLWAYTPTVKEEKESEPVVQQVRLSEDRI
jgi:hypothetical protein